MPAFLQTASLAGNLAAALSGDSKALVCRLLLVLLFVFLLFLLILSAFLSFLFPKAAVGVWAVSLCPLRMLHGITVASAFGHACMAVRIAARKKGQGQSRAKSLLSTFSCEPGPFLPYAASLPFCDSFWFMHGLRAE